MSTISCPLCAGPVELQDGTAVCAVGHAYAADTITDEVAEQAERALWAAVRALEDQASTVRWRQANGETAAHLGRSLEQVDGQAALLRKLLAQREPDGIQTQEAPADW